ncbi:MULTISPECIES: hypothetical protein [unclassified Variovorax]|uniref:hypothetical protein n=1 Tax=unclassified Variovorax TaxID=663243 RepID=UPI0032E657AE
MDFEGIYCFDTATVRFAVYPDGPDGARVLAQISQDVLHDALGAKEIGEHTLHACKRHFDVISAAAVARFRADPHGPIVLACADFGRMRARR